jgi:hypothetical protein
MEEKVEAIIKDVELYTGNYLGDAEKRYYTDGATDTKVFSLAKKYLIKITDLNTIKTQVEFFRQNHDAAFQNLVCHSEDLGYLCFDFIDGERFLDGEISPEETILQLSRIVGSYCRYPHDGYGFLNEEHVSWRAFLLDEIEYARRNIGEISTEKVMTALDIAGRHNPEQFLMHGDFGAHNFLVEKGKIRVIDPMPLVGDYLYDFYFALLSNNKIFDELGMEAIYRYFGERDLGYRRALMVVALYVRMSRAAIYDEEHLQAYIDLYRNIAV